MNALVEFLGLTGIAIAAAAYLPQIIHLAREHCSAGLSLRAYLLWCISALLLLLHALMIRDLIFILLQACNLTATVIITILAARYRNGRCPAHIGFLSAPAS